MHCGYPPIPLGMGEDRLLEPIALTIGHFLLLWNIWHRSYSCAVELCIKNIVILLYESDHEREQLLSGMEFSVPAYLLVLGRYHARPSDRSAERLLGREPTEAN